MGHPRLFTFSTTAGSLAAKCPPLSIIGQPHDLKLYSKRIYDLYNLRSRVPEDVWNEAITRVQDGGTIPVYLNKVTLTGLLCRPSRHNCPFGSHDLHRIVKSDCSSTTKSGDSVLCILCEPPAILSYAAAVARAFPLFSRKTSSSSSGQQQTPSRLHHNPPPGTPSLHIEFLVLPPSRFCSPSNNGIANDASAPSSGDFRSLTEVEATFAADAAHAVRLTQRIVDTPPDEMNVSHFLSEIRTVYDEVASSIGAAKLSGLEDDTVPNNNQSTLSLKVFRGDDLVSRGFGGIVNVGRAAEDPPALAVLTYRPSTLQAATGALCGSGYSSPIAWVGKGIVYDTGGLALKSRPSMSGMKRDCGGAAAVLGAFYLTVKRGFSQTLHAIFCLAENAIGPKALRIDDIITLYSGKTVEITNPDAEGRLVVSDGIAYARQQLNCGTIVDMCTLTGAQSTTTGKIHAAVMSNDQELEHASVTAGRFSGDLTFPVLYAPDLLLGEFSSAVADFKNSVSDRGVALVSCAGHFIEVCGGLSPADNPPGGPPLPRWLHIDMASPVASGERATGYGVALLSSLFASYSADPLLRCLAPPTTAEQQQTAIANAVLLRQQQAAATDVEMVAHTPEPSAAD